MALEGSRRFLFSATSGYGRIHPLIPLARALKEAGHEVAFATSASRQAMLEGFGFTFFPTGGDLRNDAEYQQVKAQLQAMPLNLENELVNYATIWCRINPRLRTPQLVEIAQRWKPDMVVREGGEYGAAIAAEHLSLPHATVAFTTALKGQTVFERHAAEGLNPTRQQWGLSPDPDLSALYRYLYLAYSPPSFSLQAVEGARSVPTTTHFFRPDVFDNSANETLPDWVRELPAQPTVYVTMGTEVNTEPELYPWVLQTIIEGLRELPVNLIVTLGRDKDPAEFGPQPANVRIERYIPQSLLLPHCDLMVMHGGSNSLLAAVDVGLPMVVIPLIADQFFNADILERMELGQVVRREHLTPATVRAAVEAVLTNPLYRNNIARLREEMHALPDQSAAVRLLEQVAAERKPIWNESLTM